VLLVGFMGAGKSIVGARLARRLGFRFVDVDAVIEADAGRTVAQIFAAEGEEGFRRLEAETVARLLTEEGVVLAPGGGWAAVPGRLQEVPEGTASVWLRVGPEEAVRRASTRPGSRPLLDVADPVETARSLIESREAHYRAARFGVDTERLSVEDVTARVLEFLRADLPHTTD